MPALGPSHALLRTFAAVPLPARVVDVGCGDGRHAAPLAALGFDVVGVDPRPDVLASARAAAPTATLAEADAAALPLPDGAADWAVLWRTLDGRTDVFAVLDELRRVVKPGGWAVVAVATEAAPHALTVLAEAAGWALAEAPVAEFDADEVRIVRGVYRHVAPGVAG